MQIKKLVTHDELELDYYVFGNGPKNVLITNAPGMSIKLWIPIINNLKEDYTFYGMEYRGFPSEDKEPLSKEFYDFDNIIKDCLTIIEIENLEKMDLFSWCVGSKLALSLYKKIPEKISSLTALNCAYKQHQSENLGTFAKLMYNITDKVNEDAGYVDRMVKIMKKMGTIPTQDFLEIMGEKESDSPSLEMYQHLDGQSPLAGLSFYLIDTPSALLNYLNIYQSFGKISVLEIMKEIECPFFIINGSKDNVIRYHAQDLDFIKLNPFIDYAIVEEGSHYMMVDVPRKISRLMKSKLDSVLN